MTRLLSGLLYLSGGVIFLVTVLGAYPFHQRLTDYLVYERNPMAYLEWIPGGNDSGMQGNVAEFQAASLQAGLITAFLGLLFGSYALLLLALAWLVDFSKEILYSVQDINHPPSKKEKALRQIR